MTRFLALTAVLAVATPAVLQAQDVDLDALRLALDKYQNVNVALAEGYIPDPSGRCIEAGAEGLPAALGGMGIHYLNPAILGLTGAEPRVDGTGTQTDLTQPAMLLYEPQEDGTLALVGVESLVFEAAWTTAGNAAAPTTNGRAWDSMADDPTTEADEGHGFMPHYDQHIWLWREAAEGGEMQPFNANVTCEHAASGQ